MKTSLHFGLNHVSTAAYGGWDGELRGCHNDARAWQQLALKQGFENPEVFLDEDATVARFRDTVRTAAVEAEPGDTVLISYSGHGSQLDNPAEPDGKDETLCFFDGELRDDELRALFGQFKAGVRVIAMLDCCHSGGLDRALRGSRGRFMPHRVAEHLRLAYSSNTRLTVQPRPRNAVPAEIRAGVVLFTACRENEVASDGDGMGAFSDAATSAWRSFWLRPSYERWFEKTRARCRRINPAQNPCAHLLGARIWGARAL